MNALERFLGGLFGVNRQADAAPVAAPAALPPIPQHTPPMAVPIQPRVQQGGSLPAETFTPNRVATTPDSALPLPGSRPVNPVAGGAPVAAMPQIEASQASNPLAVLLMGGSAGGDWRQMVRAAGAGMGNLRPTGGDPFLAFAQGFGGTQGYYQNRDAAMAETRRETEQEAYERAQTASTAKFERDRARREMEIAEAAENRAAEKHEMELQKSAVELRREARLHGITTSEMIRIHEEARQYAKDFAPADTLGNRDLQEMNRLYEQKRDELLGEAGGEQSSALSARGGITRRPKYIRNDETGEVLMDQDGQWVPVP